MFPAEAGDSDNGRGSTRRESAGDRPPQGADLTGAFFVRQRKTRLAATGRVFHNFFANMIKEDRVMSEHTSPRSKEITACLNSL